MKIKILKDDKNYMVLDKPADLVVHADGKGTLMPKAKSKQPSIAEYILKNFKKIKGVGEDLIIFNAGKETIVPKPGIVHRLDKDTTGCLIIAKNQTSYLNFKKQFQNHTIKKEYMAIVWGYVKQETGLIDASIARSKTDFRKKEVVKIKVQGVDEAYRGEERDAVTRYKVVKRFELFGQKLTLVTYLPQTGRMHQIRIHSKSIGHPIVGDQLYGPNGAMQKKFMDKFFGKSKPRQLLHAKSITFSDPKTGELVKVESPIPKDFKPALDAK